MKSLSESGANPLPKSWAPWLASRGLFYAGGMLLVLLLKHYYSVATASGLRWILTPTARLAGLLGGMDFVWREGAGYVNHAHGVTIAPACAGINFLIICFAALYFSFIPRYRSAPDKGRWLLLSAALAYLTTLVVNSLRIVASVYLYEAPIYGAWLTPARVHEMAGVTLFMVMLVTLWLGAERLTRAPEPSPCPAPELAPHKRTAPRLPYPAVRIPFACYILITIVVPWLNGAASRYGRAFAEHAAMVLLVSGGAFLITNRVIARGKKNVDRDLQTKEP